jgi:hypothetical protein
VHSGKAILAFCRMAHRTVRCTPDTVRCGFLSFSVAKPTVGAWEPLAHRTLSRADRAADRWPGRPLAHRTVRCTSDSPVNYSRTPPIEFPRAASSQEPAWRTGHYPVHHRTVRCTQTELALDETKLSLSNLISPVSST